MNNPGVCWSQTTARLVAALLLLHSTPVLAQQETTNPVLEQFLVKQKFNYDPAEKMLVQKIKAKPAGCRRDNTVAPKDIVAHPTRESFSFANALLATNDPALRLEAYAVLRRILALQDQDPRSRTYGLWSQYLEDDLAKLQQPDYNWADFIGADLLKTRREHGKHLPPDLAIEVEEGIRHAARSIQRRDVSPDYTNIATLGTFVTLVAAETFGDEELQAYAMERLRRFHAHTFYHGNFTEYNSPSYQIITMGAIAGLRRHVKNEQARQIANDLHRVAWNGAAQHFHPPTGQWAGPHSRLYETLLSRGERLFRMLKAAPNHPTAPPRDLRHFFERLDVPREVVTTFRKADLNSSARVDRVTLGRVLPLVGTTYLTPQFALGSINIADFWAQRRGLIAYWGTEKRPSYLRLRFLHDGIDFVTPQILNTQRQGDVLAGIVFPTDGGDCHPLVSISNGRITTKDLRLRFEFGGAIGGTNLTAPAALHDPIRLQFEDVRIVISAPVVTFGQEIAQWESGKTKDKSYLDLVLYKGEAKEIALTELDQAVIGLALRMASTDVATPAVKSRLTGDTLTMTWDDLSLRVPTRPAKMDALHHSLRQP